MEKFIELVKLPSGETVAVGPFHLLITAKDFERQVEKLHQLRLLTGARLLTRDALARELGLNPSLLKG
jgi:hypothetical protein